MFTKNMMGFRTIFLNNLRNLYFKGLVRLFQQIYHSSNVFWRKLPKKIQESSKAQIYLKQNAVFWMAVETCYMWMFFWELMKNFQNRKKKFSWWRKQYLSKKNEIIKFFPNEDIFSKKNWDFFLQNGETSLSYIFQNLFQNREIFFKIKGLLTNSHKMGDKIIKKFC